MLAAALLLAFLFDTAIVLAFRGMVRRSAARSADGQSSRAVRAIAFGGGAIAIATSAIIASLATASVQAEIIVIGMSRYEPFRTIIATDPREARRIREAVDEGLRRDGRIRDKVYASVQSEVEPYLKDRAAHAPDDLVVAMARMTLASLAEARRDGVEQCHAVMGGTASAVSRYDDGPARQALLARIVAAPYRDNPDRATPAQVAQAMTVSDPQGTDQCDMTIHAMTGILRMPTPQAAMLLRGMTTPAPQSGQQDVSS